uniref:Heme lyase n=1 Tax=Jakoba bahamiensis TaxID=221721 RepID=M4QKZ1_9EUKA|nr:heme lyase [Jakoba bahamiensis]AGH24123.1 heme lyase [Jakoba bahamiensis]
MLLLIGTYFLFFSILLSILYIFFIFHLFFYKLSRYWSILHFIFLTICIFCLFYGYLHTEFSVYSIYLNDSSFLPLFYKFSALWSNHEGSMLLWCWVLSAIIYSCLFWEKCTDEFKYLTIWVLSIISFLFEIYTFSYSNPFQRIEFRVLEGSELLPILQDPVLIIHPPIIYIGYLLLSIPFSLFFVWAYLVLYKKISWDTEQYFFLQWVRYCSLYTLLSASFLTFGIALGSWWAYYELGWGGWWFWDPVENASLLPWISSIILIHLLLGAHSRKWFRILSYHFSFLSFFISLFGTFLVRSGILESVHSFVSDSSRGYFLLLMILFFLLLYLIFVTNLTVRTRSYNLGVLSQLNLYRWPDSLFLSFFYLILFLFIILWGMFYSLFQKVFYFFSSSISNITIGPEYYNNSISLFLWSFLFFLGISSNRLSYFCILRAIVFSGVISLCFYLFFSDRILLTLFDSLDLYFCLYVFYILIENMTASSIRVQMFLSHFFITLFIFFVKLWSLCSVEFHEYIRPGDKIYISNSLELLFRGCNLFRGPNYETLQANFLLLGGGALFNGFLFPEKRHYFHQDFYSSKVDIITNPLYDLQVLIGDGHLYQGWSMSFYYYPFMLLIWISCFGVVISFLVSFFYKWRTTYNY